MALDIVKLYISLLSELFKLSDIAIMSSPRAESHNPSSPLIPTNSTSLSTAHYLMKISGEIQECVNELNAMDISNDVAASLKGLLESVKWRFEEILINVWQRGRCSVVARKRERTKYYRQTQRFSTTWKLGLRLLPTPRQRITSLRWRSSKDILRQLHSNWQAE